MADLSKFYRAIRPDAQAFDEVRIITVPRYKTSGLSGDEWRTSAVIQFFRKGVLKHEASYTTMEYAVQALPHEWLKAYCEGGKAFFGGEGDFCDQEGCKEKAVVTYALKKQYCRTCGKDEPAVFPGLKGTESGKRYIRRFCLRHAKRGDCALEDADSNYEVIEAPDGFDKENLLDSLEDVSPSAFGGVVDLRDKPDREQG